MRGTIFSSYTQQEQQAATSVSHPVAGIKPTSSVTCLAKLECHRSSELSTFNIESVFLFLTYELVGMSAASLRPASDTQ